MKVFNIYYQALKRNGQWHLYFMGGHIATADSLESISECFDLHKRYNGGRYWFQMVRKDELILGFLYVALIIVSLASLIWAAVTGQVDLNNW